MGQEHHRQGRIGRQGRRRDPIHRFLHGHRTKHGQGTRVEPETATGTGRPASHYRQAGRIQAAQTPAAMAIAQQGELALQGAATGVAASVMVSQHTGHRQLEPSQPGCDQLVAIAEVADHHQGIGPKQVQELLIQPIPLAVQVSSNGDLQVLTRVLAAVWIG